MIEQLFNMQWVNPSHFYIKKISGSLAGEAIPLGYDTNWTNFIFQNLNLFLKSKSSNKMRILLLLLFNFIYMFIFT